MQDSTGTEFEDKEYKYYVESVSLIFMNPPDNWQSPFVLYGRLV